jgi:hypothetical protein
MQFTLLASLAVLCSAAFAAPARRDDSSLIGVDVIVDDVLDNADITVLKRDVLAAPPARRDDDDLIGVDVIVDDVLNDADINILKRYDGSLIGVLVDVQDDLDDLDVNVLTKRNELPVDEFIEDVIVELKDDEDKQN